MTFEYAPAVREVAEKLVAEHHQELQGIRVEYVWRNKPIVSRGKVVLGKARKITGLAAFLSSGESLDEDDEQTYFVIEVAKEYWPKLTNEERIALVDHELTHCTVDYGDDGENKLSILPHDLEDFLSIFRRYGAWSEDAQRVVAAIDAAKND